MALTETEIVELLNAKRVTEAGEKFIAGMKLGEAGESAANICMGNISQFVANLHRIDPMLMLANLTIFSDGTLLDQAIKRYTIYCSALAATLAAYQTILEDLKRGKSRDI